MEIQYVIINFIILSLILVIFGRKMVLSIFRKRMDRVNSEFEEIERIENAEVPELEEFVPEEICTEEDNDVLSAKQNVNNKISQIEDFGKRECHEIHRDMIENARKELYFIMKESVSKIFSQRDYHDKIRNIEKQLLDEILSMIELTPGDMTYLKHSDVLYVTLTSAFELPEEYVKLVEEKTTQLLDTVNGRISLWVLQDSTLIGGLKLRIGDTIYDATVSEELYRFEKSLARVPILDDDAAKELFDTNVQSNLKK